VLLVERRATERFKVGSNWAFRMVSYGYVERER
jgi:hypothetical protein